ncbi:MAG: hypothetical protein IT305_32380, partial [Chloroflexi bacterium]|nr:hypothetical protein [Chloroflexota bacterium]
WGFELDLYCRLGGERGLSCRPRRVWAEEYGEGTSDQSLFTGHYFDTETNLYYAKARYFDPELGRFLSQDSYLGELTEPPSLHRYLYAADRPTYYVDPDGHEFTVDPKKKYGPDEVGTPVLSGTVTSADLDKYLAYVGKHGSREQVIQATLGATGVYSKAFGQEVAKLETSALAGAAAGAPVAMAGGGVMAVGAVGGGTQGFVSGLLDKVSAAEVAVRTATGAVLGGALGWAGQKLGFFTPSERTSILDARPQGASVVGESQVAVPAAAADDAARLMDLPEPPSNLTLVRRGDATYYLDANGLPVRSDVPIVGPHPGRGKGYRPNPVGGRLPGHHRGHLAPENLVANPKDVNVRENIISEAAGSNLGPKKAFENEAGRLAAESDGTRFVSDPIRDSNQAVPKAVTHYVVKDGKVVKAETILNRD